MRRRRLVAARKLRHLGNGVDLRRFRPDALGAGERAELRASWGVDDETVVVGTVGRLVAEKGYLELFEAVSDLGPEHPPRRRRRAGCRPARRPRPGGARAGDGGRCRAARSSRRRRPAARRLRPVRAGVAPRGPAPCGDGGRRIRAADRGHRRARLPSGRRRRDDRTARARGRRRARCARRSARSPRRPSAGGRWARRRGRRPSASSTSARSCAG